MAPWSLFSGSGNDAEQDLPNTIEPHVRGVDTAFELFIDGALTKVYNEASGRSKDQKALRAACKKILGEDFRWPMLVCVLSDARGNRSLCFHCSQSNVLILFICTKYQSKVVL